jgi:hypothetical protein
MEENHNTLKKTADFLLCLKVAIGKKCCLQN